LGPPTKPPSILSPRFRPFLRPERVRGHLIAAAGKGRRCVLRVLAESVGIRAWKWIISAVRSDLHSSIILWGVERRLSNGANKLLCYQRRPQSLLQIPKIQISKIFSTLSTLGRRQCLVRGAESWDPHGLLGGQEAKRRGWMDSVGCKASYTLHFTRTSQINK